MKVILIEILILLLIAVVLYAIRNKIRFFRGGYTLRKASYMQDEQMKLLVEDLKFFRHKERNVRSLRVDGGNLVYSRIPLDPSNNMLLVYSYCAPLLAMLKGVGATPNHSLVLGGGGCAVPLYLLRNYEGSRVDIVEISEESIRISKEYFLPEYANDESRVHFIHDDARNAVAALSSEYQFIFCDLYNGGQPANIVYSEELMQHMSRLAGNSGLLVINGSGFTMDGTSVVLKNLLATFQHAWVMLLSDGFVLLARNTPLAAIDNLLRYGHGVVGMYPNILVDSLKGEQDNGTTPSGDAPA